MFSLLQISGEFCNWLRGLPEGEDDTVNKTTPEQICALFDSAQNTNPVKSKIAEGLKWVGDCSVTKCEWQSNTEFLLQRTVLLSPGIVFKSCIKVRFSIKAIGPVIRFHYCPFALQKKRSWRSWVKFGTNIGGTVSGDWANMAQQELCKAKVRKRFSALKKKFNESQDSSSMSQFGRSFSSKKSKSFVYVLEVTVVTIDRYFYL